MGSAEVSNPRTSCPHLASGLSSFESKFPSPSSDSDIVLANGDNLLLSACSLTVPLRRITIQSGASLVFNDQNISISVKEIQVDQGGKLLIGSETCRLWSYIQITFLGTKAASAPSTAGAPSKGILAAGTVEIHGKQFHPTWTRLSVAAKAGDSLVILQDPINWEVGQQILFTTSSFFDCPKSYERWCAPCKPWELSSNNPKCKAPTYYPHQNEIRMITAISKSGQYNRYVLSIDRPLTYDHYSGLEYQSEVALLSRRISFAGQNTSDDFGGHMMIQGNGVGRFSGVQVDNFGQLNVLGRYPFHLHLLGDGGANSFVQDCSVINSNFRAYTIHGTNKTRLSRNVAYNVRGFAVYLEDGVEENNLIEYNLMAHVHPVKTPANGDGGQGGQQFSSASDLLIPADASASGYYISNAFNDIVGNAASGGWSGFAFPNLPKPIGNFFGQDWGNNNPLRRPTKSFVGNTAHSSGFYWSAHGAGVYVGAWLTQTGATSYDYDSGRHSRSTVFSNGSSAIMYFEDTKVWATNKGVAHWGDTVELRRYEAHDLGQAAAMLFGEGAIADGLINLQTSNYEAWRWQNDALNLGPMGFQFYDTFVKTILSRVTFRNFGTRATAVRFMDHSDHYTPQGINSVRGLRFENVSLARIVGIANCGAPDCPGTTHVTHSARIYSVWDFDGSLTQQSTPSILGSNMPWWKGGSDCVKDPNTFLWICAWKQNRNIINVQLQVPGISSTESCSSSIASNCTDQYSPYTVGFVTRFGESEANGILLPPWPSVSGYSGIGWHWRTKLQYGSVNIDGAPATFYVGSSYQMAKGEYFVLSVTYPSDTTFTVKLENLWGWGVTYNPIPMAASKSVVTTAGEDLKDQKDYNCTGIQWWQFCSGVYKTTGAGLGAWFFENNGDGTGNFYLRVVNPNVYNNNQRASAQNAFYRADGIYVSQTINGFRFTVTASSSAASQSYGGNTFYTVADHIPSALPSAAGNVVTGIAAGSRSTRLPCTRGTFLNGGAPQITDPFGGSSGAFLAPSIVAVFSLIILAML